MSGSVLRETDDEQQKQTPDAITSSSVTAIAANNQSYYNNSLAIRQEIQRFESVHPSIYAIYDLLELSTDPLLAQQIREHVVCIEDSFVNSQEWTLSRAVPDLRLGIVGSITSGKSALVHRYLTGSYLQDESPEGGRFKKDVIIEGQSYLLLIRDEGGAPQMQFSSWADAVIFVFSLENEASFNAIYNYYPKMFHFRSSSDVPIILVGTQDAINESNPRVIDENRARKLAADLNRCSYYETCATFGLNVEKVFQDACQKIVHSRVTNDANNATPNASLSNNSRPNTPNKLFYRQHSVKSISLAPQQPVNGCNNSNVKAQAVISPTHSLNHMPPQQQSLFSSAYHNNSQNSYFKPSFTNNSMRKKNLESGPLPPKRIESKISETINKLSLNTVIETHGNHSISVTNKDLTKELPTPTATPTTARKTRRRSNLFPPLSTRKHLDDKYKTGEVGSGRAIPVKQGYLYKKSIKTLNKDWKKKYVTLTTDGRLTYHPTLHDYMEDIHGKNIPLKHTTVKIPGQKPRGSRSSLPIPSSNLQNSDISSDLNNSISGVVNGSDQRLIPSTNPKMETPSVKKRHRRPKNSSNKNNDNVDDSDAYEFIIVSLDNKQWHFDAINCEEREGWVTAIEQQILASLQNMETEKSKYKPNNSVDNATIHSIRNVSGNTHCVDCGSSNPDWSSLNLGALICIECSGIHRNLGTHISKVRSLALDNWTRGHMSVMLALGNTAVNNVYEHNIKGRAKPKPNSSREEKERWIRAKYDHKEFLLEISDTIRIEQQLINCVLKSDVKQFSLIVAHITSNDQINALCAGDGKTPLHIASMRGCLAIVQLLLWHNANVKAIDSDGRTALYYANTSGHKEVEELLLQSGCSELNGINSSITKRRGSLTSLAAKTTEMFENLPASII